MYRPASKARPVNRAWLALPAVLLPLRSAVNLCAAKLVPARSVKPQFLGCRHLKPARKARQAPLVRVCTVRAVRRVVPGNNLCRDNPCRAARNKVVPRLRPSAVNRCAVKLERPVGPAKLLFLGCLNKAGLVHQAPPVRPANPCATKAAHPRGPAKPRSRGCNTTNAVRPARPVNPYRAACKLAPAVLRSRKCQAKLQRPDRARGR